MADETTQNKNEPVQLNFPNLPTSIQGDGRYVMSLLRAYLEQATQQINLANGFTQEDEDGIVDGAVQTPRNFRLTFDRNGGLFSWDHIKEFRTLAYYELRTDTLIGTPTGLLERTVHNSSTAMSVNAVDHIYLYAFDKEGQVSNAAELVYNKPRPDAPSNIATSKSQDGTLISYSDIPSNCIGANIYVDGVKYTSTSNNYLIKRELTGVDQIEVAFYDPFGEGERGILYFVLPDVQGLLVERNGPELDFYWEPVNVYNVKYMVKVCEELSWSKGLELFKTSTNDKNRRLYPNRGTYYLMVKAFDDYGNFSKNAAYQVMTTETDISRNVILEFPQKDVLYSGTKINLFYNPIIEGITLDREAAKGEYIFEVNLPQEYKARNWLELSGFSWSGENRIMWQDAHFTWGSAHRQWAAIIGDIDSSNIKQEISMYRGMSLTDLFSAKLDGDLLTEKTGESPFEAQHADDFRNGRWAQGLYIGQLTKLAYTTASIPEKFSMVFYLKADEPLKDVLLMTVCNDEEAGIIVGYDSRLGEFFARGSDGKEARVPVALADSRDYYAFGFSQGEEERTLFVYQYSSGESHKGTVEGTPLGRFNKLYCYPKVLVKE